MSICIKRILLLIFPVFGYSGIFAQTVLISEYFTNYDSTTSSAGYNGWTLTYFSQYSYYTSTQSSGPSGPNSYKFGVDSATAISPVFTGGDSIRFWMKGNSTSAFSTFYVYETSDGTIWNPVSTINPVPATGTVMSFAVSPGTIQVKFFYDKDAGNVAFDDFMIIQNAAGLAQDHNDDINVFPSPTTGLVKITMSEPANSDPQIQVFDMIGNKLQGIRIEHMTNGKFQFDLSSRRPGLYLVKVNNGKSTLTRRVTLRP